jgi:hypothetical protein
MNYSGMIAGIDAEIRRLQQARDALAGLNSGGSQGGKKGGGISAAGRRRIAAAQRARWARVKRGKVVSIAKAPKSRTRKISAAGRARIAAAQRRRWAALRSKQ